MPSRQEYARRGRTRQGAGAGYFASAASVTEAFCRALPRRYSTVTTDPPTEFEDHVTGPQPRPGGRAARVDRDEAYAGTDAGARGTDLRADDGPPRLPGADDVLGYPLSLIDRDGEREADVARLLLVGGERLDHRVDAHHPAGAVHQPPELPWFTAASVWIAA
jgi:hypothetical protein